MAVSDTTVQRAYAIICSHEGGYTSINKNDNGAVSIGRLQWRGNRALELLKEISKTRQIILFSCHKREAEYFAHDASVNKVNI